MRATLNIQTPYESRSVKIEDEISLGRTEPSDVVVDDPGLSRVNTTFFIDEGLLWVADEDSTNGTFLNGQRISGRANPVRDGDRLTIGSHTTITVEVADERAATGAPVVSEAAPKAAIPTAQVASTKPAAPPTADDQGGARWVIAVAAIMTVLILLFGGIAFIVVSQMEDTPGNSGGGRTTASSAIPVRVIDPLGGEDYEDIQDILAAWEVAEEELVASDVADINISSPEAEAAKLNVSAAFLAERQRLALAPRNGPTGIRHPNLDVPKELFGDGVIKQTRKLAEMRRGGYQQPMDFADLAIKRLGGELIEMPMAANEYYLDVGGSAQDVPFTSFEFSSPSDIRAPIVPGHPKFDPMQRLASNFAGQRYDLNDAGHRKQIRRRLLRMFHPRAKPILEELGAAYLAQFGRPLRVTSLTRSMDYQILLSQGNANAYKVRGQGALPPHTSGCAFDLARKHMTIDEQNFLMKKLAEMERENKLDALIEYGVNACFHVFIYPDGMPPRQFALVPGEYEEFPYLTAIRLPWEGAGHSH